MAMAIAPKRRVRWNHWEVLFELLFSQREKSLQIVKYRTAVRNSAIFTSLTFHPLPLSVIKVCMYLSSPFAAHPRRPRLCFELLNVSPRVPERAARLTGPLKMLSPSASRSQASPILSPSASSWPELGVSTQLSWKDVLILG